MCVYVCVLRGEKRLPRRFVRDYMIKVSAGRLLLRQRVAVFLCNSEKDKRVRAGFVSALWFLGLGPAHGVHSAWLSLARIWVFEVALEV